MAFLNTLVTVFFLLVLSTTLESSPIEQVCSGTKNKPLCFQVLNSNFDAIIAVEVAEIGNVPLDNAQRSLILAFQALNYFYTTTDEPVSKKRYLECMGSLATTCWRLQSCRGYFVSGNYSEMLEYAHNAAEFVQSCETYFPYGIEPYQVKMHNKFVADFVDVVAVVASSLLHIPKVNFEVVNKPDLCNFDTW